MFESAVHAAHRFVEQHLDDALQEARLEFEVDKEIEAATARHLLEHPMVVEVAEWSLGVLHIDAPRRIEPDPRREALAEHAKADDQISDNQVGAALANAGADAPWQKFGISLDIGDQREQLFRRVRQNSLL